MPVSQMAVAVDRDMNGVTVNPEAACRCGFSVLRKPWHKRKCDSGLTPALLPHLCPQHSADCPAPRLLVELCLLSICSQSPGLQQA